MDVSESLLENQIGDPSGETEAGQNKVALRHY
jgi:hypothetical protein